MKSVTSKLLSPKFAGLILGLAGLLCPLYLSLPGLSFAGHLALGIFIMAAMFWMFEPIPIYSTSLAIIFLGVLLLSAQGLVFKDTQVRFTNAIQLDQDRWLLPETTLGSGDIVWVRQGSHWHTIQVRVHEKTDGNIIVSGNLDAVSYVAEDASNRAIGFNPGKFHDYIGTLANPIIILFLGGFMIAEAAVKFNLDRSMTRFLLRPFGTKPGSILIGLMLITAVMSAFMSNTATTAMMMTVIIPIMLQMEKGDRFKTALALSIPIAANIGGIATPIGTPPNAVVIAALHQNGIFVSFTEWMIFTTPLVILLLGLSWLMLTRLFPPNIQNFKTDDSVEFNKSPKAVVFYITFAVTLVLWITESLHGVSSSIIALVPITVLTLSEVLVVDDIRKLPWEVLWLVAGGLSLGIYMDQTALATYLVSAIDWAQLSGFAVIALFAVVAVVMSNFLSNTVTATLLMPLALGIALIQGSGTLEILEMALVIGMGTSLAMVLPISTPPNAIAMATGMVKTADMARTGVVIGSVGIILMLIYAIIYWPIFIN